MKNKFIKRTLAIILAAISIISVASFAATNASAAAISGRVDIYNFEFYTGDMEGATTAEGIKVEVIADKVPDISEDFNFSAKFVNCGTKSGLTKNALRHFELGSYLRGFRFTLLDKNDPWFLERVEFSFDNQDTTYSFGVYQWITDSITLYPSDVNDNIYKFTIKTSDSANAGTDGMVTFDIHGNYHYGNLRVSNATENKSCFNKGNEFVFYENFGSDTFDYLAIRQGYDRTNWQTEFTSLIAADWKIESVKVEKVNGAGKENENMNVTLNQWIDYSSGLIAYKWEEVIVGKNGTPTNTYKVEVKTSDKFQAGTDADIEFQLLTENGNSHFMDIDRFANEYTDSINNFEKNDKDCFQMVFNRNESECDKFGKITGLNIKNTGGGAGPDWHVDYIKLTEIVPDGTTPKTYTFHINDWIDSGETYCCTNFTVS